jgi:hypothetical protein
LAFIITSIVIKLIGKNALGTKYLIGCLKVTSNEKRGKNLFRLVLEVGYDAYGKRIKRSESIKANGIREAEKELTSYRSSDRKKALIKLYHKFYKAKR